MIAYFILVHRYPEQFKRLFQAVYSQTNHYVVHIDKRSSPEVHQNISRFLSAFSNTSILQSEEMLWGGYSLVNAELRGIAELLKVGKRWDFFINLSGQDFPLKSQAAIHDYLRRHKGKDFIKVQDQRRVRPETLSRIKQFVSEIDGKIVKGTESDRTFLEGVTPYIGNQWMIASRKFCEFLTNSPEIDRFKEYYKNSFIADESFFQTVIMNTSYKGMIVNDDKRAIDWVPDGDIKLRPRTFTMNDAPMLKTSQALFARKFDVTEDAGILTLLERFVSSPFEYGSAEQSRVKSGNVADRGLSTVAN